MYGSEWSTQEGRSGKLYLFDITELQGSDLTNEQYITRYSRLQKLSIEKRLPDHWKVIANYPTLQVDAIWSNLVESGQFEGLVFRNPTHTWHTDILRAKLSITKDLRVIDFEEGKDRLTGMLGAVVAVDDLGGTHSIGGGFTDKQRKEIWGAKEFYRGKTMIVEAKKQFASGKLRHPNFIAWHPDK